VADPLVVNQYGERAKTLSDHQIEIPSSRYAAQSQRPSLRPRLPAISRDLAVPDGERSLASAAYPGASRCSLSQHAIRTLRPAGCFSPLRRKANSPCRARRQHEHPRPERPSVWVMKFTGSGCFPAETAGLSWTVTSQTARYRDAAPRHGPCRTGHQIGHSLIAARSPVMSIIAWIVLGLGAGLLAIRLIPNKRSQGLVMMPTTRRCRSLTTTARPAPSRTGTRR
jgi:hypothetical protein